jgi:hypothetical protein
MLIQMPLPGGRGAAYIVQRGGRASWDQTDLNKWFRLILTGVEEHLEAGPIWFQGVADGPHHWAGRSGVGPIRGPLRPGGSLILLDASFLGAKGR